MHVFLISIGIWLLAALGLAVVWGLFMHGLHMPVPHGRVEEIRHGDAGDQLD